MLEKLSMGAVKEVASEVLPNSHAKVCSKFESLVPAGDMFSSKACAMSGKS